MRLGSDYKNGRGLSNGSRDMIWRTDDISLCPASVRLFLLPAAIQSVPTRALLGGDGVY